MEETFYTLQQFMLHSETITYIIMGVFLLCIPVFWSFLTERDDD